MVMSMPLDTRSSTVVPVSTSVFSPATARTSPSGLAESTRVTVERSCSEDRVAVACSTFRPTRDGTCTILGPEETVMVIREPFAICVPPAGCWARMTPSGMLSLVSRRTLGLSSSPAFLSSSTASSVVRFVTSGTSVISLPEETAKVIWVPRFSSEPAAGLVEITLPRLMSGLGSSITLTEKPRPSSSRTASLRGTSTSSGTCTIASCTGAGAFSSSAEK